MRKKQGDHTWRGRSVHRAITILIYLAEHRFGADKYELADLLGINTRQVWRILKAIHGAGVPIAGMNGKPGKSLGGGVKRNVRLVDRQRAMQLVGIL